MLYIYFVRHNIFFNSLNIYIFIYFCGINLGGDCRTRKKNVHPEIMRMYILALSCATSSS